MTEQKEKKFEHNLIAYGPVSNSELIRGFFDFLQECQNIAENYDINEKNMFQGKTRAMQYGIDKCEKKEDNGRDILYYYVQYIKNNYDLYDDTDVYGCEIYTFSKTNGKLIPVGYVEYSFNKNENYVYISTMLVQRDLRKMGIGTELHKHVENFSKYLGAKFISLDSVARAKKFHRKNNFTAKYENVFDKIFAPIIKKHFTYMIKKKLKSYKPTFNCPYSIFTVSKDKRIEEMLEKTLTNEEKEE